MFPSERFDTNNDSPERFGCSGGSDASRFLYILTYILSFVSRVVAVLQIVMFAVPSVFFKCSNRTTQRTAAQI